MLYWENLALLAWISNYMHMIQWDVITHPCHKFLYTQLLYSSRKDHGIAAVCNISYTSINSKINIQPVFQDAIHGR